MLMYVYWWSFKRQFHKFLFYEQEIFFKNGAKWVKDWKKKLYNFKAKDG